MPQILGIYVETSASSMHSKAWVPAGIFAPLAWALGHEDGAVGRRARVFILKAYLVNWSSANHLGAFGRLPVAVSNTTTKAVWP